MWVARTNVCVSIPAMNYEVQRNSYVGHVVSGEYAD